jgi:hypothetical protein
MQLVLDYCKCSCACNCTPGYVGNSHIVCTSRGKVADAALVAVKPPGPLQLYVKLPVPPEAVKHVELPSKLCCCL